MLTQILNFWYFSSFVLKENVLNEEDKSSQKSLVEEELNDIDTDGIGILENLPRHGFIDKECKNPKVVI